MIRHDSSEHNEEQDGPGTPGVRALGAMAAAARRAREVQEGGPPTQAVEISFDDAEEDPPPPPRRAPASQPEGPRAGRSPLELAVWLAAALVLVAAGALAVTLGTNGTTSAPSALPTTTSVSLAPHSATHASSRSRGNGVRTSPATSSTTTTTTVAVSASGPPVIAALSPSSGTSGQAIQVAGANFLSSSGQIVATFNGQVAPTSCPAQNACSVTVPPPPAGAQTAQVVITTPTGTSNTMTFTYT